MKRFLAALTLLALLMGCGGDSGLATSNSPDVAISQIDGPLTAGQSGALVDAIDARKPRTGPLLVAADQQFDPVSGQTTSNPISVYVTATDELGIDSVDLSLNGQPMGNYAVGSDAQVFKNPFIFPAPRSGLTSVPIPGAASGLVGSTLRASTQNRSGETSEPAVLELQADGSRPNLDFSATSDITPPFTTESVITLSGRTSDPETGIVDFAVFLNGEPVEVNPETPNLFDLQVSGLEPGSQTVRLAAVNGVLVPNDALFTFQVIEAPEEPGTDNAPPTVTLAANPSSGAAPLAVIFTATAQDAEEDPLTYTWDFGNGATASSGNTQSTTYAEDGTYTATVTVSDGVSEVVATTPVIVGDGSGDGGGGGNGNEAPTATIDGEATRAVAPNTAAPLSATASDPEDNALTYSWSAEPSEGVTFSAATAATTEVTFASAGTYTITLTVSDGNGGVATDTVTFTVGGDGGGGGGNTDAPTISSFTATPAEPVTPNTSVTLAWELTGSPTTVTITPQGSEAIDVTGDSTLTVTPAATTTYALNASNAAGAADPQTVTVTVQGEDDNGGVNAVDDTADTTPGEPVTVDVLANDEPGADALIIVAATSPQQGGTVQISRDSKSITYTPKDGFTGQDTFSYTVRDADLNKSSAKVTVQVEPAD